MHPIENIRASASHHLSGRRIVLGVTGSIAAVKCVELSRELVRHGADVQVVMTKAATSLVGPDAMEFASGNPVTTRLTGQVEHVQWLGDVPDRADLLLIAPATANTVSKMALGIDDSTVTTCATVAFGNQVPVVVAPAMHDAMLRHPVVMEHAETLRERLGVTWVEPKHEEKKAKLADIEAIVEAVIHRLAIADAGPLAGKTCLVVGGATAETVDPVRILTNRSSGRSALILARELRRRGADVRLWFGRGSVAVPSDLAERTTRFESHAQLMQLADSLEGPVDQIWMPAAISDYVPEASQDKIPSGQDAATLTLKPVAKVIEALRAKAPDAVLVGFKAESDAARLLAQAEARLSRYGAQFMVANTSEAFGATDTSVLLVHPAGHVELAGTKEDVLAQVVDAVASGDPGALVSMR